MYTELGSGVEPYQEIKVTSFGDKWLRRSPCWDLCQENHRWIEVQDSHDENVIRTW